MKKLFSCVRLNRIKSYKHLSIIQAHGERKDETCRRRCDPLRSPLNVAISKYAPDAPLDLKTAYKALKMETGATEYKGGAIGLHMLLVISPDAIEGNRHDPNNKTNQKMIKAAQEWGEKEFGKNSVLALRMDMDEKGAGVVDLFIVPVREVKQRNKIKNMITPNKALDEIAKRHKKRKSYEALQDSWHQYAMENIDKRLQRGLSKTKTQKEHVHSDIIAPALEQAKNIKENAVSEFSEKSFLGKVATSVDFKRKKEYERGKSDATKQGKKVINKWKKQNEQLSEKLKLSDTEKSELKNQISEKSKEIIKLSVPDNSQKHDLEAMSQIIEDLVNFSINNNVSPLKPLESWKQSPDCSEPIKTIIQQLIEIVLEAFSIHKPSKSHKFEM